MREHGRLVSHFEQEMMVKRFEERNADEAVPRCCVHGPVSETITADPQMEHKACLCQRTVWDAPG